MTNNRSEHDQALNGITYKPIQQVSSNLKRLSKIQTIETLNARKALSNLNNEKLHNENGYFLTKVLIQPWLIYQSNLNQDTLFTSTHF
jgi:hypothetical protein